MTQYSLRTWKLHAWNHLDFFKAQGHLRTLRVGTCLSSAGAQWDTVTFLAQVNTYVLARALCRNVNIRYNLDKNYTMKTQVALALALLCSTLLAVMADVLHTSVL